MLNYRRGISRLERQSNQHIIYQDNILYLLITINKILLYRNVNTLKLELGFRFNRHGVILISACLKIPSFRIHFFYLHEMPFPPFRPCTNAYFLNTQKGSQIKLYYLDSGVHCLLGHMAINKATDFFYFPDTHLIAYIRHKVCS